MPTAAVTSVFTVDELIEVRRSRRARRWTLSVPWGSPPTLTIPAWMGDADVDRIITNHREWIADGQSGWVFPGGNSEALSKVLLKVAENEQNRQEVALRGRAISLARADARKNFPRLLARIETLAKLAKAQPH